MLDKKNTELNSKTNRQDKITLLLSGGCLKIFAAYIELELEDLKF